jgi:glutathione S-transferase
MDFIDARLSEHAYIVGEKFTTADIVYASAFALFMANRTADEACQHA